MEAVIMLQNPAVATPVAVPDSTEKVWPTYDHEVGMTEARDLIARYKRANPGKLSASAFTRVAFDRILAQDGCCGIRMYYALTPENVMTLVLVGVDELGNDLDDGELAEMSYPCPPFCPMDSALDS
jgi:hypothetical protein